MPERRQPDDSTGTEREAAPRAERTAEAVQEAARARVAVGERHIAYGSLLASIDVIYGAIYGYVVYALVTRLQAVLSVPRIPVDGAALAAFVFVAYLMLMNSSECRVYNAMFPYAGRVRFMLDLAAAGGWLLALIMAERATLVLLPVLSGVIGLRMIWCVCLEYETRARWVWKHPRLLVAQHLTLAVAFVLSAPGPGARLQTPLSTLDACCLWLIYAPLVLVFPSIRRAFDVPAAEVELLPIGIVHRMLVRGTRSGLTMWDAVMDFFRPGRGKW